MVAKHLFHRELEVEDMQTGGVPSQLRLETRGLKFHQLLTI